MQDKRRYKRLAIDDVARCRSSYTCQEIEHKDCLVISLSAGGVFFILSGEQLNQLSVGSILQQIQFEQTEITHIRPNGIVVYKLDRDRLKGIGVAFQGLPSEQIRELDEFVNQELRNTSLFQD